MKEISTHGGRGLREQQWKGRLGFADTGTEGKEKEKRKMLVSLKFQSVTLQFCQSPLGFLSVFNTSNKIINLW